MPVKLKRAYEKPGRHDGVRVLVEGLWPRGVSKAELGVATWEKAVAPSKALRAWYGHDPEKWPEFQRRYREELGQPPRAEAVERLVRLAGRGNLTLVFGARDEEHSNAAVVADRIDEILKAGR